MKFIRFEFCGSNRIRPKFEKDKLIFNHCANGSDSLTEDDFKRAESLLLMHGIQFITILDEKTEEEKIIQFGSIRRGKK